MPGRLHVGRRWVLSFVSYSQDSQGLQNANSCSQFNPWSTAFADNQTPCYSTLEAAVTPPPMPDTLAPSARPSTISAKPTSAVCNIVYSLQYHVKKPTNSGGLAKKSKIGIGAGAGAGALVFAVLVFLLLMKRRSRKRDHVAREPLGNFGPESGTNRLSAEPAMTHYSAPSQADNVPVPKWRQGVRGPVQGQSGEQFHDNGSTQAYPVGPKKYSADWTPGSTSPPNSYSRKSMGVDVTSASPPAELSGSGQQYPFPTTVSPIDAPHMQGNVYSELYGGSPGHRQNLHDVPEDRQWGAPGERTRYD